MRLFPQIKVNISSFLKNGKIIIITFLVFPMMMAYIYGTMQKDLFSGKSSFKPITAEFKYDKTSKEGEILTSILKESTVKNFIDTDSKEELKCKVSISKDFNSVSIEKLKASDSDIDTEIIKSFMKTFSENINQYSIIMNNVEKINLSPVAKGQLTKKLVDTMAQNNKASALKERVLPGYKTLGAREYYTISMFSYTSIMLIMILVKAFYKNRKNGVVRRSFSTPNSKGSYLLGYLISSFMMAFAINVIYILINRILGIAFLENILLNVFLAFIQSILQAAVITALIAFIKSEQVVNALMTIMIIIPVIAGGVFFNGDLIEVKVLKVLSNFSPNSIILDFYKNLSITGNIIESETQIMIALILSLALVLVSFLRIKANWEE
jgi:ABC-2 type transport system permease protein